MKKRLILGHKQPDPDSICSALALQKYYGRGYEAVSPGPINDEVDFILKKWKVKKPRVIKKVSPRQEVILVDHNEKEQWLEGINKENIIQIIDHHPLGDLSTNETIDFNIKPWGATATIITHDFYLTKNKSLDKKTAGLLLSAILSDTMNLRTNTTTVHDREMVSKLASVAEVEDWAKYGHELFKIRADHQGENPREMINLDYKEYGFGPVKIGVGQVLTSDWADLRLQKDKFLKEMDRKKEERDLEVIIVLLTNYLEKESLAWIIGSPRTRRAFQKAFRVEIEDYEALLKGVTTRKNQLIAPLQENLELLF